MGYRCVFITLYRLHSGAHAIYEDMADIAQNNEEAHFDLEERYLGHSTESHHELSFVDRYQDVEMRFNPDARERTEGSEGFSEDQNDPISTGDEAESDD